MSVKRACMRGVLGKWRNALLSRCANSWLDMVKFRKFARECMTLWFAKCVLGVKRIFITAWSNLAQRRARIRKIAREKQRMLSVYGLMRVCMRLWKYVVCPCSVSKGHVCDRVWLLGGMEAYAYPHVGQNSEDATIAVVWAWDYRLVRRVCAVWAACVRRVGRRGRLARGTST